MTAQENAKAIEEFLKDDDWHYTRVEQDDGDVLFTGGVGGLGGAYDSVRYTAVAAEGNIQAYAMLPANAKEKLPEMAEFLHRANYNLRYGSFELDWSDGEIRTHISFPDCVLSTGEAREWIASLFIIPPHLLGRYSKGIAAILLGLATPEQAIKMCEGEE